MKRPLRGKITPPFPYISIVSIKPSDNLYGSIALSFSKKDDLADIRHRYDLLTVRAAVSSEASFRWCISPSCTSGHFHDANANAPIFTCNACGHKACVACDRNWHKGETCAQVDKRMAKNLQAEAKSTAALNKLSKPCPGKDCSWRIQRNGGCAI